MATDSVISFKDFLDVCPYDFDDIDLSFENLGTVRFTTITS